MDNSEKKPPTQPGISTQSQKPRTRLEDLRQILDQLEKAIARLPDCTPGQALDIPISFDRALALMEALEPTDVNLDGPTAQFQTLAAQFRSRMKIFQRKTAGGQVLVQARQVHQPSQDHWWWFVDEILASERKSAIFRRLRNLGIAAVILVAAMILYRQFFAPDPAFQASLRHQQNAENLLLQADFENALFETEAALEYTSNSAELLILKGVIHDRLGHTVEASEAYAEAKEQLDEKYQFYVMRARNYLMMEEAELVLADCDAALELNPDSAVCLMQQGLAYELLGDISSASERLELADDAAEKLGNAQLQAIIRVNLANLLQKVPATITLTPIIED